MAQPGKTKVFLLENATTKIYTYVNQEIATGAIDGANKSYTVTTAPVSVTGLSASPLVQYVDGSGNYFRKDVLVQYRLNNEDTEVDTSANAISVSGTTLTFTNAPTTAEADNIVVSYCHTASARTDEILNFTPSGGGRADEYVTVQGGDKVRIEKVQDEKTVALEVLSVDGGFVQYVNGYEIDETIAGQVSGSDLLRGSVGGQSRTRRAIVLKMTDPETDNVRLEMFFNVLGISNDGTAPSDGYFSETTSFQCPPQDYCRVTRLVGQG